MGGRGEERGVGGVGANGDGERGERGGSGREAVERGWEKCVHAAGGETKAEMGEAGALVSKEEWCKPS